MKNIFLINGHQHYEFAPGRANQTFIDLAREFFAQKGYATQFTATQETYNVEEEVEKHLWADIIFFQSPINWMGTSWSFKKYIDEVYTVGMMGKMCNGDGRSRERPKENYGMGGLLTGTQYMLSLTANAPREAFDDPNEPFFQGMSVDDLFRPTHLNFKFMGMEPLPTFSAHDLMKNPEMEQDIERFKAHLAAHF